MFQFILRQLIQGENLLQSIQTLDLLINIKKLHLIILTNKTSNKSYLYLSWWKWQDKSGCNNSNKWTRVHDDNTFDKTTQVVVWEPSFLTVKNYVMVYGLAVGLIWIGVPRPAEVTIRGYEWKTMLIIELSPHHPLYLY